MKYIILTILLLIGWSAIAHAQILTLERCTYKIQTGTPTPFYAIQEQAANDFSGTFVFQPDGTNGWTYYDLNGQEIRPTSPDSSSIEIPANRNGKFEIKARKEGKADISSGSFTVFHVYVPPFSISLGDPDNCEMIRVKIDDFTPAFYTEGNEYDNYSGSSKAEYWLSRNNVYRTVPITFNTYPDDSWEGIPEIVNKYDDSDQNATYQVKIVDCFGFEWISDKVDYTSVIPKAAAKLELMNTVDIVGEVNDQMGQAPLEVVFYNESQNAFSYEWLLYKDTAEIKNTAVNFLDSLIDNRIRTEREFSYTYPNTGRYKVLLIAINGGVNRCRDTSEIMYVNVIESLLEVPNVFTPNGDGKNDVFMVKGLSLEEFKGVILNRWGRKVYEWNNPTDGWDGRINGKYANPGTYYYVVTARGREKNNPPQYVKKGALMLIR